MWILWSKEKFVVITRKRVGWQTRKASCNCALMWLPLDSVVICWKKYKSMKTSYILPMELHSNELIVIYHVIAIILFGLEIDLLLQRNNKQKTNWTIWMINAKLFINRLVIQFKYVFGALEFCTIWISKREVRAEKKSSKIESWLS